MVQTRGAWILSWSRLSWQTLSQLVLLKKTPASLGGMFCIIWLRKLRRNAKEIPFPMSAWTEVTSSENIPKQTAVMLNLRGQHRLGHTDGGDGYVGCARGRMCCSVCVEELSQTWHQTWQLVQLAVFCSYCVLMQCMGLTRKEKKGREGERCGVELLYFNMALRRQTCR